jgi:hypothetical protein
VACGVAIAANEGVAILLSEPADEAVAERVRERAQTLGLPRARVTLRLVRSSRADDVISALTGLQERLIVMTRTASAAEAGADATRISAARGVPALLIEGEPDADLAPERRRRDPSMMAGKDSAKSSANS